MRNVFSLRINPNSKALRRASTGFTLLVLLGLLLLALLVQQNRTAAHGLAGVVGTLADNMPLDCGGRYDPAAPVAFSATADCGALVQVTNPATGAQALLPVVHRGVMFSAANGRVLDISPAAAGLLGFPSKMETPAPVAVRAAGWLRWVPVVQALLPALHAPPEPKARELKALAMNVLGECHICGPRGMVAVAQVTLNRVEEAFNDKASIHAVVWDENQFSWTRSEMRKPVTDGRVWAHGVHLAKAVQQDRVSGDLLAVRYLVTKNALYYYAFDVMATPKWGKRGGKLEVVPMPNTLEVELRHRFFRERLTTPGTMLAKQ